jgi:hypothetical protein
MVFVSHQKKSIELHSVALDLAAFSGVLPSFQFSFVNKHSDAP